ALPASVTLRQPGGRIGTVHSWIDGSPEFLIGERVLVFLRVSRDGTLRVLQLYQGKLSVMVDPLTGDEMAIRINGGGVRILAPLQRGATPPPKDTHRLDDLRRTIRAVRGRTAPPAETAPMQTAPVVGSDVTQQQEAFVYMGTPSRWFEPDNGSAITMYINSAGQPGAPTQGFDQIHQGEAAWSNDPHANFAEVATHELGHVLGLGHSTDTTATMYATAHFDGRGAALKADDLAGLRSMYPAAAPVPLTLAFSAPANGATVSGTTPVSLSAAGGVAPYGYQVWLDGGSLSSSASFSWNTTAVGNGAHTLSATVTDAAGSPVP